MSVFSPSGVTLPAASGDNADLLVGLPTVETILLLDKALEYTITLPQSIKRFALKTRQNSVLRLSYTAGETLLTEYITLDYGVTYSESNLSLTGAMNVYLRANKGSVDIELLYWS